MADLNATLANHFAELKRLENSGNYEKALKTAEKILSLKADNPKAAHCKVVCLIQHNQFEQALDYLDECSDELKSQLLFEKAYCQYRLNKVQEALQTLQSADLGDSKLDELRVQSLYRVEQYDKCYASYVDLIKNSSDDYEDERYVNLAAVCAGLCSTTDRSVSSDVLALNENTYELVYNKACVYIAENQLEKAIQKLNEAQSFACKFLEEDGMTDEEIEMEVAIIKAQIAFCYQKLGKSDISLKMYNQVLRQKLDDAALIAVCSCNIVAIHKDQNVFDSKKKIKLAMSDAAEHKLSSSQKRNIYFNYNLFLINTAQYEQCRKQLQVFKSKFPLHNTDALIIETYLHIKEKNPNQAIKVLSDYCDSKKSITESDLEVALLLTQLHMQDQNWTGAIKSLEKLADLKYRSAVFSVLYLLYEKLNDLNAIEDLFRNAINWHESHKVDRNLRNGQSVALLCNLYREFAKFYLNQNKPQQAVKYLEKITQNIGKNAKITSMLINAYSQFDQAKAQSLQKDLPSIEEILSSVDIEHLENKNWSLGIKYVKKSKDTPKGPEKKKKKKKNRKKILPKNFNPNEQPDPERWLPKYERSNYRKKKDKKAVGKGTQGSVAEVPEIKPSPKQVASPQGPRQQRPTQKKKKKTGRK